MKYWILRASEDSMSINLEEMSRKKDFELIQKRKSGKPIRDIWRPVQVKTYKKGKYKTFPYFMGGIMVLRPKVISVLQEFLEGNVELLPIIHPEDELYFGNVINVVDCLDRENSELNYNGDIITKIYKYVFFNSKLENVYIFTLPEKPGSHIFVSDKFKNRVEEAKLKGFDFEEVWDTSVTDGMREEQTRKYNEMIKAIEQSSSPQLTFDEAYRLAESGRAVASGKWKLQMDAKGRVLLGQLNEDCTYAWIPMYIPPILLGLKWREVENMEDVL